MDSVTHALCNDFNVDHGSTSTGQQTMGIARDGFRYTFDTSSGHRMEAVAIPKDGALQEPLRGTGGDAGRSGLQTQGVDGAKGLWRTGGARHFGNRQA